MTVRRSIPALALLAAAAVALSLGAAVPAPAMAQTCQITKNENGQWERWGNVGEVVTFGDLKIRVVGDDIADYTYFRTVDIKAPGFQVNGVRLENQKPVKFTACGQEVTLTFDAMGIIRISMF